MEFDKEYAEAKNSISQKNVLDVVEMNIFEKSILKGMQLYSLMIWGKCAIK